LLAWRIPTTELFVWKLKNLLRLLFRLERSLTVFLFDSSTLSAKVLKFVLTSSNWLFCKASRLRLNNSIFLTVKATASKGFLTLGIFLVCTLFLAMTGWDANIWCFRLASFVGAAFDVDEDDVAVDEDDVALDEDDVVLDEDAGALDEADVASDDDSATLAVDVADLNVTTGDAGWLLVVEEMLTSKLSSLSESLCS
jgi:hypothetical protein